MRECRGREERRGREGKGRENVTREGGGMEDGDEGFEGGREGWCSFAQRVGKEEVRSEVTDAQRRRGLQGGRRGREDGKQP